MYIENNSDLNLGIAPYAYAINGIMLVVTNMVLILPMLHQVKKQILL